MAEKYAGLTLGVDVSQVDNATKSLRSFKQANDNAKKSVENFVDQEVVAKQRAKEHAQELQRQRKAYQDIQGAIDPTASKMERLRKAATQLDSLWKKGVVPDADFFELSEMLETQQNKLAATKKALTEEGRAALEESKNKARAAAEGKKFVATLREQAEAAGKTRAELAEMKAAQLGVSAEAAPFIAQMKQQEKQMKLTGISAGQYSQAMKMLPMQITDVVTSLASGMPVWMVAIQQGGQIKDSFGGIGGAIKGILSYINPLKVGIGAVVGVLGYMAVSAYKAKTELEEIKKTVQDTTGVSGEFAKDLAKGVQYISQVSGKTASEIASTLATTKDSASEVIKKMVDVGYSYSEAAEKVSQYRGSSDFTALNADVIEHQRRVADLEKTWWDVAKARLKAMGSVLVGDPQGEYAGKKETRRLSNLEMQLQIMNQFGKDNEKRAQEYSKQLAEATLEIDKQNKSLNRVRAAQDALNEALRLQSVISKGGTAEAKKQAAENVAIRRRELAEIQKAEAQRSKPKGGTGRAAVSEQLDKELYVLEAQLRTLKEHRTVNDVISNQRKSLWSIEKQIEILEEAQSKRRLTSGEQQLLNEQKTVLEMAKRKAELGDKIKLQERENKLYQDGLKFINETQSAIERVAMAQRGQTDEQIRRELELQRIRDEYISKGGAADDTTLQDMLSKQKALYAEQDKLSSNWFAGAKNAWNQYGEDVKDVYSQVNEIASSGLNGLSDQLTEFLTTGKASFSDFASSIISMIVKMIAKMVVFNTLTGLFGGGKGAITIGSLLKGFSGGGYTGNGGKYDPAGIVHKGEFVFTKEATQRIGAGNLYKLMRGYANGGSVGGSSYSGSSATIGGGSSVAFGDINVDINNGNDPKGMETGVRMIVTEMMKRACTQGGEIYEFVMAKRG